MNTRYTHLARTATMESGHQTSVGPLSLHQLRILNFAKILQNWKAILDTRTHFEYLWEVTHNGDKNETYVDLYQRTTDGYQTIREFADSMAYTPELQAGILVSQSVQFEIDPDKLYVVWQTVTSLGWTAMVSTDVMPGQYWKVSYNDENGINIVERYVKKHNLKLEADFWTETSDL